MKNFILNICSFFYNISRYEIYWKLSSIYLNESVIDKKTKIAKPYHINYVIVGFGTYISEKSRISQTEIGKFCSIGPNLLCGFGTHPLQGISTSPVFFSKKKQAGFTLSEEDKIEERKKIIIGNDVFIGANVTILDGVKIGDGAVIGAGAVVNKDIPPYAIAVGCPIRVIKYRFDEETINQLLKKKWWDGNTETLKSVEKYFFNVSKFLELNTN